MKAAALELADSRLRIATRALADMKAARSISEFADHWFVFLTAWKGVYTVLEQGAKLSAQSRQWFGKKKAERKDDPLLQYLFHARNDEEHGLAKSVEHRDLTQLYQLPQGSHDAEVRVILNPHTGRPMTVRADGGPIELVLEHGPGPVAVPVSGRGNLQYLPPVDHLGQKLADITPQSIATVALDYAVRMVAEARKDCEPSPNR